MANEDARRGDPGLLERLINYTGTRLAVLRAVIIYNSSETEIFTAANPGTISISSDNTSQAGSTGNTHEPAANTAAVVTLSAGGSGVFNVLGGVYWSYSGDPSGGSLTITDGGSTVFKVDITKGGPGFFPFNPLLTGGDNAAVVATLAAGGSSISGIVNVHAWTE